MISAHFMAFEELSVYLVFVPDSNSRLVHDLHIIVLSVSDQETPQHLQHFIGGDRLFCS